MEQRTLKQGNAHRGDEMNRRSEWAQREEIEGRSEVCTRKEDQKYAGKNKMQIQHEEEEKGSTCQWRLKRR